MRVSEMTPEYGALDELGAWGFGPMECMLDLMDRVIEEDLEGCGGPLSGESDGVPPEKIHDAAGRLLNIQLILKNQLKDIQDFVLRYESDYVHSMKERLEALESGGAGGKETETGEDD